MIVDDENISAMSISHLAVPSEQSLILDGQGPTTRTANSIKGNITHRTLLNEINQW